MPLTVADQPPDSRSLDDYLAHFYQEGTLESQGRFRLDLEQRSRKAAQYQLSHAENFILPLIMAATMGGARTVQLQKVAGGFAIVFDGQIAGVDELPQLRDNYHSTIADSALPRLRHLQTALRLLRQLSVARVVLQLGTPPESLTITGPRAEISPGLSLKGPGLNQALLLLHGNKPMDWLWGSRLSKIRASLDKLLRSRCALVQDRIHPAAVACLQIGQGLPEPQTPKSCSLVGQLDPGQPHLSGFLSLLPWQTQSPSRWVCQGVSYPRPTPTEGQRRPYQLVLQSDRFEVDLTYENLIESDEVQQILQQLPAWFGELEWTYLACRCARPESRVEALRESWQELAWDVRQRALHHLPSLPIVWNDPGWVRWAFRLGGELDFEQAGLTYGQLRFLPISTEMQPPSELENGLPVFAKPTHQDELLDRVYPRQIEYLSCFGRAVPAQAYPGQLLSESEFWERSDVIDGFQLGLNLRPQAHPATVWHFEPTPGVMLQFVLAEQPSDSGLAPGMTLARLDLDMMKPITPVQWQPCLEQLLRRAWTHPKLDSDPARHDALLQHWLLALSVPTLQAFLDPSLAWAWTTDGRQLAFDEFHGSRATLSVSSAAASLLQLHRPNMPCQCPTPDRP